jgi:hypothetical protein
MSLMAYDRDDEQPLHQLIFQLEIVITGFISISICSHLMIVILKTTFKSRIKDMGSSEYLWSNEYNLHHLLVRQFLLKFGIRQQKGLLSLAYNIMLICNIVNGEVILDSTGKRTSQLCQVYLRSSPYCQGVVPFVDLFLPQLSNSVFNGCPWFLVPVGLDFIIDLGSMSVCILSTWQIHLFL